MLLYGRKSSINSNCTNDENKVYFVDLDKRKTTNYNTYVGSVPSTQPTTSLLGSIPMDYDEEDKIFSKETQIAVIDFNGDGKSDFLIFTRQAIRVFSLNAQNNQLIQIYTLPINNLIHAFKQFHIGDFNGDGKTDFVLGDKNGPVSQDNWLFYISDGITYNQVTDDMSFDSAYFSLDFNVETISTSPSPNFPIISTLRKRVFNIQAFYFVEDLNGDGKTDIGVKVLKTEQCSEKCTVTQGGYPSGSAPVVSPWIFDNCDNLGNVTTILSKIATPISCNADSINFKTTDYGFPTLNWTNQYQEVKYGNLISNYSREIATFKLQNLQVTTINPITKNLLSSVTKGNGSTENIFYKLLKSENITTTATPAAYNIFTPSTNIENYPNFDLNNAQSLMVVSKLEKTSKTTTKKQLFAYFGAVSNMEGLGFLGFRSSMRTDWFDDETKIFSNITNYDISRRGAPIANFKIAGFVVPSLNYNPTEYISKSINTYNTATDALQTNKVFKQKNTKTETWNKLDNTSSETTSVLDVYNNPTLTTTHVKNGTIIEKTTTNTIVYDNQPSATTFVIGRPTSKIVNTKIYPGQANEDIAINEEQYAYTNHLLSQIKKKATNSGLATGFLTEDNEFDPFGNIKKKTITAVGETPRVTNFEYSTIYGSRFLTKSIDVELLETIYTYEASKGLVLTELMPSITGFPLLTTNTYDVWGKKIKVKNYLSKEVNYAYTRDSEKTLIIATSDDGSGTTELYDDLGRKIKTGSKTIDGTWAYTETEYDNFDRAIKTSEPFFDGATKLWNETTFDNYGRPLQIKAATGKIANYTYPSPLTVNVNDGTLNKTNVKNALGNVISLTDTPGGTITYNYFANGNLKKTVYSSQETIISQDGWGRKTKLIEPSAGEYNYTYNGFGQPLTETTPNGKTAYTYTTIGKLYTKWVKGKPSPDGTFSGTNILSAYAYYPSKMLEKITVTNPNDGNSIYNYNYDNYKRIIYTKEDFTTVAPRKFENNLEYDDFGRILSEISTATINGFVSAKTVFNEYKNGELFKKRENSATGNPIWTLNTRNARGQITSATLGDNLMAQTNTYHALGHTLTTNYNKIVTPNTSIMLLTNDYDFVQGNMLTRSNSLFAWNETFTYDSLDRLTGFTDKNGAQTTQEYEENGKIKSNFLGQYRYSTAKPYQNTTIKLSTAGQQEAGLMVQQTIVYSAFKAPISITQGAQKAFFGYNFAQDRSVMYFGNSNTNKLLQPKRRFYSADGTMEITMTLATATVPASYEFTTYIGGDAYTAPALARQVDNQTSSLFYLHRDHLGTILAITNNLGNVVEKRLFDAWGDIIKVQNGAGAALTRLTFIDRGYTGHEHLQSFRLINMNGRLYDPRLHRFLQPDNNLQEPNNTQNYNRYGYCFNNPLRYTDPSGEDFWDDLIAGVAIVAGAILVATGVGTVLGAALISAGVSHFAVAASNYFTTGSSTNGNWDASSTAAGFTFSTSVKTDFGYGGTTKDIANNNNPIESHPQVASTGAGGEYINMNSFNSPPGSDNFNFFDRNSTIDKGLWYVANSDNKNIKGVVKVYAHGGFEGMMLNGKYVTSASTISTLLYFRSETWRNFRDNGGKLTLVLKSCQTGEMQKNGKQNIAQILSQEFKGLTVIAPTDYWHIKPTFDAPYPNNGLQSDGSWNFNKNWVIPSWNQGWIDDGVKDNGTWNFYYNGNLIKINDGK